MNNRSYEISTLSDSTLVFGILGLAFSSSFWLAPLGIVFSAVALSKARKFFAYNGLLFGKARVGRILALVGLPVGIALSVLLVFYIIALAVLGTAYISIIVNALAT